MRPTPRFRRAALILAIPLALGTLLAGAGATRAYQPTRPAAIPVALPAGEAPAQPTGPTTGSLIVADINYVLNQGYDPFDVVSTYGPDGSHFIAIAAARYPSADGAGQWVFFFNGTTYLGTDTAKPSLFLSLVGSPKAGEVDVRYVNYAPNDPLCCQSRAPVTITYTWDGSKVTPSGTPPGHS